MSTRTRTETVTFGLPFVLDGLDEVLPAGAYEVEIDEELIEGISFPAFRRVLAIVHLRPVPGRPGMTRSVSVDPAVLDAALARDRAGEPARCAS